VIFPTTVPEDEMELRIKEWEVCGYVVAGANRVVRDSSNFSHVKSYILSAIGVGELVRRSRKPLKGRTSGGRWFIDHGGSGVSWIYCYEKQPDGSWKIGSLWGVKKQLDAQARKQIVPTNRPTKRL